MKQLVAQFWAAVRGWITRQRCAAADTERDRYAMDAGGEVILPEFMDRGE